MKPETQFAHESEVEVCRLYPILRGMANQKMAFERAGHTLQPTALANEAWLRMRQRDDQNWRSEDHFCAAAAETMRRILIDRARRRNRQKHGGDQKRVPFNEVSKIAQSSEDATLLISEVLEKLEKTDPLRAKLVLLKFFGGFTNQEIAQELSVTERTVERYWAFSKAWLYREIQNSL